MLLVISFSAIAGVNEKFSTSTLLFLAERDGRVSLDIEMPGPKMMTRAPLLRTAPVERKIARAESIDGIEMVPAFIHINPDKTAKIEALGVIVQECFDGFITALIPVDKIELIAKNNDVKEINVAQKMNICSNKARSFTNTDDIINYSSDAIKAGIPQAFKGNGIVIGVIDQGIDFQHRMFKDSSGKSRIKLAYIATSKNTLKKYTNPTTDDKSGSHGTHTTSIAAGSNITVGGITYGGMAPEANLVLIGLGEYPYTTNIANGIKYVFDYADSQNMPAVCSISLGTHMGPHDGTGELASIYSQYAGSHSNHIIVVSAGNEAGGKNGKVYCGGASSTSAPFTTILYGLSGTSLNNMYDGCDVFYARTANKQIACKLHIVNTTTKAIEWTSKAITSSTYNVTGITKYFKTSPIVIIEKDLYSNKYYVCLDASKMEKQSSYNNSKYALAISVYPKSGSCAIDAWNAANITFGPLSGSINGYKFYAGNDNVSINEMACSDAVISVGAYCSKNKVVDYSGSSHSLTQYTVNDIAYFSSYKASGYGPNSSVKPDICAPGATVVAGINHYDTEFMANGYSIIDYYLVSKNGLSSLGNLSGTSMSAPCVAGIIALYLQAAKYSGKTLNTAGVRDIFSKTAIKDSYTTKKNFGRYGKIDALAGIKSIVPLLDVNQTSLSFGTTAVNKSVSKTLTVKGTNLTGSLTLSTNSSYYTVTPTTITASQAATGCTVTVTYKPGAAGTHNRTLTIKGGSAANKTVSLSGKCAEITTNPTSLLFAGYRDSRTITVTGTNLTGSLTLKTNNENFTVTPTTITAAQAAAGYTVTVKCNVKLNVQRATGTLTISGGSATSKLVSLTFDASGAVPYAPLVLPEDEQGDELNGGELGLSLNDGNYSTAVDEMAADVKIYAEGQNVIIESAVEQSAVISDVAGRARSVNLQAGRNEIPVNSSGLYIVRTREKTAKLLIK